MTSPYQQIAFSLNRLGVKKGSTILVHSSLKSFGWVKGGAETVIRGLLLAVGAVGNVMVPTLTGSSRLNRNNPPFFNVKTTPCWTGRIPETFRKLPQAKRSLHPTHSVSCIGADTHALLDRHHVCPTPCGKRSPYFRLAKKGGLVVLFGVDFESVTLFHTIEELARLPYHLQPDPVCATIKGYRGKIIKRTLYIHQYGAERNFSVMEPILKKAGGMKTGKALDSFTRVINAELLVSLTLDKLQKNRRMLLK